MDLVVGAPNLFDRKEGIGGAVYVYINQAGDWDNIRPIRLNGSYDSMFGITVGAVGDLNQDSFQGENKNSGCLFVHFLLCGTYIVEWSAGGYQEGPHKPAVLQKCSGVSSCGRNNVAE